MFSFADTPVKFVVLLLLFLGCTLWSGYELTRPQDVRQRISNVLHLVMAVVMLLMVAPVTWDLLVMVVPTFGLAAVFAASVLWFGWLAVAAGRAGDRSGLLHFTGHAAMFAAMTWHLSAMGVMEAAMAQGMGSGGMDGMGEGSGMGPMDMGSWMKAQSMPGGTLWVFALVGLPFMAYLLASSLRSLALAIRVAGEAPAMPMAASGTACACGPDCDCGPECSCQSGHAASGGGEPAAVSGAVMLAEAPVATTHSCHEVRPVGSVKFRLEQLSAFAMNFGMFWMSTGLLVPILPFFAALAF